MRIVVTGAAGFIGSHLVDRLLSRGDQVLGIDNFDPFYSVAEKRANLAAALTNARFQLLECDVTHAAAIGPPLEREPPDVIVHLAAKTGVRPSVQDPQAYEQVNVGGTAAILGAAARGGVRAFILASSSSVYGNTALPFAENNPVLPASPYAATKRAAEEACERHHRLHGGSVLCLRLFTVYGPRQRPDLAIRRFCELISAAKPVPMFGDGSSQRDYTWVGDIVDGIVAAIDVSADGSTGFQVVNLGSGVSTSLDRLAETIAEALCVAPQLDYQPAQPADVVSTLADIAKAKRLLGYAPKVTLQQGISKTVGWLRR